MEWNASKKERVNLINKLMNERLWGTEASWGGMISPFYALKPSTGCLVKLLVIIHHRVTEGLGQATDAISLLEGRKSLDLPSMAQRIQGSAVPSTLKLLNSSGPEMIERCDPPVCQKEATILTTSIYFSLAMDGQFRPRLAWDPAPGSSNCYQPIRLRIVQNRVRGLLEVGHASMLF